MDNLKIREVGEAVAAQEALHEATELRKTVLTEWIAHAKEVNQKLESQLIVSVDNEKLGTAPLTEGRSIKEYHTIRAHIEDTRSPLLGFGFYNDETPLMEIVTFTKDGFSTVRVTDTNMPQAIAIPNERVRIIRNKAKNNRQDITLSAVPNINGL